MPCVLHLQEEVEPLEEHPVKAGQVEEVGEGEGGAEQWLCKLRRDLDKGHYFSNFLVVKVVKVVKVAKVVKMSKTF